MTVATEAMRRPRMSPAGPRSRLCLLAALLLQLAITFAYDRNIELFEGSPCDLKGRKEKGECVALVQCRSRLEQVLRQERRATDEDRCGFKGSMEIVCCPAEEIGRRMDPTKIGRLTSSPKPPPATPRRTTRPTTTTTSTTTTRIPSILSFLRPADVACAQYDTSGEQSDHVDPHITNGERAAFGEFPYMVALGYPKDDDSTQLRYICGGSLIAASHVLTAAHCVNNIDNLVPVEVKVGAVNLNNNSEGVQNIKVEKIHSHPSYKRSLNYFDIAIIKLQRPVNISKTVMPICLYSKPIPNLQTLANLNVLVTGWGATSFENEGSTDLQKTPSLSIIETSECGKSYEGFSKLPRGLDDSMICVLDKNVTRSSDACQGDSGGPLLLMGAGTNSVIGVTSFGQSCGSRIPAVYTSVYYYLKWIEDTVWPKK